MSDAMFEHNGMKYHAEPDLDQFLSDAGFRSAAAKRNGRALEKSGITNISSLLSMNKHQISDVKGIT